jgi:xanthine dehydrogenase accessory factor
VSADRLLVAVFASPVSEVLVRWAAELGFRTVLVEPDPARVPAGSAADVAVPGFEHLDDELTGGNADVVVTDHHRPGWGSCSAMPSPGPAAGSA